MEFICTVNTASKVENILKFLTKEGYARLVHDGNRSGSKFYTMKYVVNVRQRVDVSKLQLDPIVPVSIRLWYDKRGDLLEGGKAGIKISDEGLYMLMTSVKVVNILSRLGIRIIKDGNIDLDQLMYRIGDIRRLVEYGNKVAVGKKESKFTKTNNNIINEIPTSDSARIDDVGININTKESDSDNVSVGVDISSNEKYNEVKDSEV